MLTRPLALAALLAFGLYTVWTLLTAQQSLLAFGAQLISRLDTLQVVIDLYLMAAMACVWMCRDNRRRNRPAWHVLPHCLLTLGFVSLGPLLYLVLRGDDRERP